MTGRPTFVALVASCLLATACSGGDAPTEPPTAQSSVTLGFSQWGPFVGTDRGLLRVENLGNQELQLTAIGLDWPGYGDEFHQAKNATLAPEQILDLGIDLPPPDCADTSAPVVGVVRLAGAEARQPLEHTAQEFVRDLWTTQCAARYLRERLSLTYGERWARYGSGAGQTIGGALVLSRRAGGAPVRLLRVEGSVLYDVALPGPTTLQRGRPGARLPIEIGPGNRCDEHAIGQATRPFDFWLELRIGSAEPMKLSITPPLRGQNEVTAMLQRVCRARAG